MTTSGVAQPGTERDQERGVAGRRLALAQHRLHGERHRRGRGVARVDHVGGDRDGVGSWMFFARVWVIRRLAWCGTKASSSSTETPARPSASCATFAIANGAQRKTAVPSIWTTGWSAPSRPEWPPMQLGVWVMTWACEPSEPQAVGTDPGGLGRTHHDRTRAVGEDERGAPVGRVHEAAQLLDADDQHVALGARAHHRRGQVERVAEACAPGGDVERRRRDAEGGGDLRGRGGACSGWVDVATMTQPTARHPHRRPAAPSRPPRSTCR